MKISCQQRTEFRKALGMRIERLRYQIRKTMAQMARHCHVSITCVQYWQLGRREPTAYNVRQLARFLCVSTDELLGIKPARGPA